VVVDDLHRGSRGESDHVWGGRGADHITAAGGHDQLSGGTGKDWIEVSGKGNDVLLGGRGDDSFYAEVDDSSGPQVIEGGRGTDFLQLNTGVVNRSGAASTGTWHMATGAMRLTLDHEITLSVRHIEQAILATAGTRWTVTGTGGDDVVAGDTESVTSPMTFYGGAGDDSFRGTDGDDVFDGGPGRDSASMWDGDDTCISVEVIDHFGCDHVS
jgi:Ca2+-binding RTX toxin-like protein